MTSWSEQLAELIAEQVALHGQYVRVERMDTRATGEVVVWFRLREERVRRAVRLTRNQLEANECFGVDQPLATVAFLILNLALEEPHGERDFQQDADGTFWLRPESWLP